MNVILRGLKRALREAWWIVGGALRLVRRYPLLPALLLLAVGLLMLAESSAGLVALGGAVLGFTLWCRLWPGVFDRCISKPIWRLRTRRRLRRRWRNIASSCGLGLAKKRTKFWTNEEESVDLIARLKIDGWDGNQLHFKVRPLIGHTVDDVIGAGEQLRHALDADRIEVRAEGRFALVVASFGNALVEEFPADVPGPASKVDLAAVPMGIQADGRPWLLPVAPHTLIAGCSGAGKGSLLWSFLFGLAPAVHSGHVRVYGIDLKGGMELAMGRGLFHEFATDPERAVEALEDAAVAMRSRAEKLAGTTRMHKPTRSEPFTVVVIDELAAITAYITDRQLRLRGEAALKLLCSQGRAVGFMVFACLQDPRKEVLPARGLFTQTIGLRLKDRSETTMVLGEGALEAGAKCHQIPRSLPGVGYVTPEDGGPPINVRAGYVSDEAIQLVASRFPPPKNDKSALAQLLSGL